MVYDYKCVECGNVQEVFVRKPSDTDTHQELCAKCQSICVKTFIPSNFKGSIVFRGEWDDKLRKETAYRKKRSEQMSEKQRDHVEVTKLKPNVGGVEVDTWSDAKDMAFEKGLDVSKYDDKVRNLAGGSGLYGG